MIEAPPPICFQRDMNIEQKVERTILQEPIDLEVAGLKFDVPPITFATMIMFSSVVSEIKIPNYDLGEDNENLWKVAIKEAGKAEVIADALAVLILGAKRIKREEWWERYIPNRMTRIKLRNRLLEECGPTETLLALMQLIPEMHLGDFFGLTTSLAEINILKPKEEVGKKEQISGQTL